MPIQENLPYDTVTPDRPNGVNENRVPITTRSGQTNPPDPMNTLLPNSVKYEIASNQWLAVPLDKGKYNVRARDEGQVVYIASTPDATSSLRITKAFDIETVNRIAIYIKGQSVIDLILKDLEVQIGGKADITSVYTKEQTEALINLLITQAMSGLTNVMQFMGTVDTSTDLDNLDPDNVKPGDVYQALDTGKFWVCKEDKGPNDEWQWEELSGTFFDLADYYNKDEVNLLLADKADLHTLLEYKSLVENFIPTFDWEQPTDPSIDTRPTPIKVADMTALEAVDKTTVSVGSVYFVEDENKYYSLSTQTDNTDPDNPVTTQIWEEVSFDAWLDPTKEGETWFNPSNGMIYLRKVSQLDGSLFWLNSLENYLALNANKWVTVDTQQTITGEKKFDKFPQMTTDALPQNDRDFATKAYVDANGGGGGTVIPVDVALLGATQTFTEQNTFDKQPIISTPEAFTILDDNKLLTKGQAKSLNSALFNTNPTITNPKSIDDLTDNALVTKGILQGGGLLDTADFAKLSAENYFTQYNSFKIAPLLEADPADGRDAVRLSYMNTKIQDNLTTFANDYYDKTELTTILQDYVKQNELIDFMEFKGSLVDYSNLDLLPVKDKGDVYYVQEPENKRGFYIYNGTSWESIGTGLNIDTTNLAKLSTEDNTFTNNNTFNLTWLNPDSGLTLDRRFDIGDMFTVTKNNVQLNQGKLITNANAFRILQSCVISPDNNLNIASFETTGVTFNTNPLLTTMKPLDDLLDSHLITKWQANKLIAQAGGGGGGTADTTNLAKLNEANTFTQGNTFNTTVTLNAQPVNNSDAVRKDYVDTSLADKADSSDVYTKTDTDDLLKDYAKKTDVSSFMEFKGEVRYYSNLPANANNGDVYNVLLPEGNPVTHEAGFYIYDGTSWNQLSGTAVSIDTTNLAKLNANNTFTNNRNTFEANPYITTPNATSNSQLITKGEVEAYSYVKADANTVFTGIITTTTAITQDSQFATKKYIDDAIANVGTGGGGTLNPDDLKDYANLTTDNSFTKDTIFEGAITKVAANGTTIFDVNDTNVKFDTNPTIENPKAIEDIQDKEVITKEYVDKAVRVVSNVEPNDNSYPIGTLWIKTSYTQDVDSPEIFTDTPEIYIKVSNANWWALHKESLC